MAEDLDPLINTIGVARNQSSLEGALAGKAEWEVTIPFRLSIIFYTHLLGLVLKLGLG